MAKGLLLALCAFTGCVIPESDPILQPIPPPKNRPPRIYLATPATFQTFDTGDRCQLPQFAVYVSDPDVGDLIIVRWFVSRQETGGKSEAVLDDRIPQAGIADRPDPAVLNATLNTPGGIFSQVGTYWVEAVASDGTLVGREPQPRQAAGVDGGEIDDPTYSVSNLWQVIVKSEDCTP